MIYLLYGEDSKARPKAHDLTDALRKKKPDASFFNFNALTWIESEFENVAQGMGLFEEKHIVFLDNIFENKEAKESIVKKISEMSEADHMFIILEKQIDKATLGKIEKKAFKVEGFSIVKKEKEVSSFFDLADALGRKDKKALWVLYQKALAKDAVSEELHGILWWQVKSMILAKNATTASEADLNPYVFKKAKSFSQQFSENDLWRISSSLVSIYHNAHRGLFEFEVGLEKFILSL